MKWDALLLEINWRIENRKRISETWFSQEKYYKLKFRKKLLQIGTKYGKNPIINNGSDYHHQNTGTKLKEK